MDCIHTFLIEKFDVSNFNIDTPKFYNKPKNETKLSYLLLKYLYYCVFNTYLDISTILRDEHNKPIFTHSNLHFNISHSNNFIACSLSPVNIGIDIEEDRYISSSAIKKFTHIDDKTLPIKIWNIKEAYSKYLGIGLKLNFSTISIDNIKETCCLLNNSYCIDNKNLYLSICYNKSNGVLHQKINFITKKDVLSFVSSF